MCGGTLVAPDVVMTAAHCIKDIYGSPIIGSDVFVNSTTIKYSTHDYYRKGIKWIVHPYYNTMNMKNDIGLIVLDAPVITVQPVKLNRNSNIPVPNVPTPLTVIGLGVNGTNTTSDPFFGSSTIYTYPDHLMKLVTDTVPVLSCTKSYSSFVIGDWNLCAGGNGVEEAFCYGDSGGPLLQTKNSAKEDVQIGIVSWSPYGCYGTSPDVYTKVSYYAGWVDSQVCLNSKNKPSTCPT